MRLIAGLVAVLTLSLSHVAFAEEEKNEEPSEPKGQIDFEVIIGAGRVDALNPVPSSTQLTGQLRYERASTDVIAAGFVASGRYDVSKNFNLGLRFPVAVASIRPGDDASRSTANLGNIELEAEWEKEVSEHVEVFIGAHVAAPTSSGTELPSEATLAGNQAGIDPVGADKYTVNKAVSSAYGDENTALWLAGYLGLIPAAGVKLRFGRLRIEPYVKVESMFSVRPESEERAIVELVAGGRVAVKVHEYVDVGVRAWGSFTLTNHEGDLNVGVVEPEVRVGKDRWRVTAGLLVPFAGELTNPEWISGRLSATASF